jgi:hypothetical protein
MPGVFMKFLIALFILVTTPVFAQDTNLADVKVGKLQAIESAWLEDLESGLNHKQQKVMALISLVATRMNNASDENRREEAEYAHVGFTARFQNIREERAELANKEIKLDYAGIQNYSKRLDSLISDLQTFLK